MSLQFGGLPVYYGRRVQRGGGILGSIARFFVPAAKKILLPAAKTMLRETMKQAPRVVGSLINNPSTAGKTVLNSLKGALNPKHLGIILSKNDEYECHFLN